ncbi:Hypothetical predicted protein [Olea europaea subsp. europaea]|uniref:Uncharacterized protein n=1 Tax=Olea europaea subsp. europaea TaxID=158383 RepID=A0A8S0R0M2_OLEEU|nr:Hypothetical predicted protein [Olea europaea subsp. europaea]
MNPRIKNWIANEQLSTAKLGGPDYFSNPNIEIYDLKPSKTEMAMPYVNDVQGKSGPSVLLLTDSSVRYACVPKDDNDDFIDPPPKWQETSPLRKSPIAKGASAAHHSTKEPQYHEAQWG